MRAGIFGSAKVASGGGSLVGTFLQNAGDGTDLTVYTFASQNLGTASADRNIVVAATGRQSTAQTITAVTVGGVSATQLGTRGLSQNPLGIWMAAVPTGTTGDIVVTFSGAMLRCAVGLWAVTGGASLSNSDFGTDTADVTGAANGFIVAAACNTGSVTFTWTNATERFDGTVESFTASGADAITVGATTITATPTSASTNGIVAVALTP